MDKLNSARISNLASLAVVIVAVSACGRAAGQSQLSEQQGRSPGRTKPAPARMVVKPLTTSAVPNSASPSLPVRYGCKLLPYQGEHPLNGTSANPAGDDFRGGIVCSFIINAKLPVFTFRIAGLANNALGNVQVSEGSSGNVIQTIGRTYTAEPGATAQAILVTVDANFDGYEDLEFRNWCSADGNCSYDFYLYDPAANRFVHNSFLSGLGSVEFDARDKAVVSYYHGGAWDWGRDTYQYRDGRYTLIRKVVSRSSRDGHGRGAVTVRSYKLREGKLTLVESASHPI